LFIKKRLKFKNKKITSYKKGRWAEKLAIVILRVKGYKILSERFKTPVGEIDVIASKNRKLVFLEVKYRPSFSEAFYSFTRPQQERIIRAAKLYLAKHTSKVTDEIQFDVIVFSNWGWRHLSNSWMER
jgi:putative endonuclease